MRWAGSVRTPKDGLRVHAEVRSTLYRHSSRDQRRLHERIVAAYRDAAKPRFSRVHEDDGYHYEHYFEHLAALGDGKTAEDLVLDADWISRKIQSSGVSSLIEDLARFPDNKVLRDLKQAADRKVRAMGRPARMGRIAAPRLVERTRLRPGRRARATGTGQSRG